MRSFSVDIFNVKICNYSVQCKVVPEIVNLFCFHSSYKLHLGNKQGP